MVAFTKKIHLTIHCSEIFRSYSSKERKRLPIYSGQGVFINGRTTIITYTHCILFPSYKIKHANVFPTIFEMLELPCKKFWQFFFRKPKIGISHLLNTFLDPRMLWVLVQLPHCHCDINRYIC